MSRTKRERAFLMNMFGGVAAVTTYESTVLAMQSATLTEYWPLNELTGTTASDVKGGSNATYSNVTLNQIDGPGPGMGRAGLWNGSTSYAITPSLANPLAGTLSLWAKAADTTLTWRPIWTATAGRTYILYKMDTQEYYLRISSANINNDYEAMPDITLWNHWALTWKTNEVRGYLNGVAVWSVDTWAAGALAANVCYIGANDGTGSAGFKGYIQHVARWSSVLTPAQIAELAAPI